VVKRKGGRQSCTRAYLRVLVRVIYSRIPNKPQHPPIAPESSDQDRIRMVCKRLHDTARECAATRGKELDANRTKLRELNRELRMALTQLKAPKETS